MGVTKSQTRLSTCAHTYITESLSCTAGTNTACKSTVHQLKFFQKKFKTEPARHVAWPKSKANKKTNKNVIIINIFYHVCSIDIAKVKSCFSPYILSPIILL